MHLQSTNTPTNGAAPANIDQHIHVLLLLLHPQGHAIECRINAEEPFQNFRPGPGRVTTYLAPGGPHVRMDSHLYPDYLVPPNYDSLLGKLIVWGEDREKVRPVRCVPFPLLLSAVEWTGRLWLMMWGDDVGQPPVPRLPGAPEL